MAVCVILAYYASSACFNWLIVSAMNCLINEIKKANTFFNDKFAFLKNTLISITGFFILCCKTSDNEELTRVAVAVHFRELRFMHGLSTVQVYTKLNPLHVT